MNIAFLLRIHADAELCNQFLTQILTSGPGHHVFIHIDSGSPDLRARLIQDERIRVLEESLSVSWGDYSQIEAICLLLDAAQKHPNQFDFVTLRSGQDLMTGTNWEAGLATNPNASRIQCSSVPMGHSLSPWTDLRWPRFLRRRLAAKTHPMKALRFTLIKLAQHGIKLRPNNRKLPAGQTVYRGSAWFTLSARDADYVALQLADPHNVYASYFAESLCGDERFIHTIIMNSPPSGEVLSLIHI